MRCRSILLSLLWAFLPGTFATAAQAPALKPFTAETLAGIKQAQQKKPFVVAFWSLHCAPCKEDIALLKAIHAKHPDLTIVLVATDGPQEHAAAARYLAQLGLGRIQQWGFADEFEERLRYSVDQAWHGELPRSYLFDQDHAFSAHSGVLDAKVVEAWLSRVMNRR